MRDGMAVGDSLSRSRRRIVSPPHWGGAAILDESAERCRSHDKVSMGLF